MPICGWEKELETRKFSIWLTLSRELESCCVPTASEDPIEPKKRPGYGWHCLMQSIDLPRYSNLMSRIFILPFTPHPHSIPRIRLFPGLGLSLAEWALLIPSSGPQLLPSPSLLLTIPSPAILIHLFNKNMLIKVNYKPYTRLKGWGLQTHSTHKQAASLSPLFHDVSPTTSIHVDFPLFEPSHVPH